jgi:ATP-dependent Clp endopeptidase proteolytic subunit ClpP
MTKKKSKANELPNKAAFYGKQMEDDDGCDGQEEGVERQGDMIPLDAISLNTLGAHLLFGEINTASVYQAVNFIIKSNLIFENKTDLTLLLNTPGGNVADGFALIDVMETSRLDISTVAVGQMASMGVLITAAGTKGKRIITKNTEIMAHQFSSFIYGKYHELVAGHKFHEQLKKTIVKHFKRHTVMTEKQINDILFAPSDRWLSPKEAKKFGICDEVRESMF